jgi:hypothetical protein
MVSVTLRFEGFDDLPEPTIDDDAISTRIEARLNDARNLFIQRVSRGGGSGRVYRRGTRRQHRASAPSEYPATDTGRLVNSIAYQMHGPREGSLFSDLEYARHLTEGAANMAARRMLKDALTEVLDNRPDPDPLAGAAKLK